jgi:transposase-like protein
MKRPVNTYYTKTCYALIEGRPHKRDGKSWDNNDRVNMAAQVAAGKISVVQASREMGCVPNTIRNWVKTLDKNNPKL